MRLSQWRTLSLEGRFTMYTLLAASAGVACGAVFTWLTESLWLGSCIGAIAGITLALLITRNFTAPINRIISALADGVASFKDGDFSVSLGTDRNDELGELVAAYNAVGEVLRRERQNLFQRELLLDSVIQASPTALLLADPHDKLVYSNSAARQLFLDGHRVEGNDIEELVGKHRPELLEAIRSGQDGLYTVHGVQDEDIYHVSHGRFTLNGRQHKLLLFKQLTNEINRQEVATWKKVIRVISHELNNSLAPISSLAHSGRELVRREETERLDAIFGTIEERSRQLKAFIEGYARFARLPAPQLMRVNWQEFIGGLRELIEFQLEGDLPAEDGCFDMAQLQQVMLNLLKNASESGSENDQIRVRVEALTGRTRISVRDAGQGMSENVLRHALVPFYSTKKTGSGLGLPLCREIIEAHGGRLTIRNRREGGLEVSFWLPHKSIA